MNKKDLALKFGVLKYSNIGQRHNT